MWIFPLNHEQKTPQVWGMIINYFLGELLQFMNPTEYEISLSHHKYQQINQN